MNKQQENTEFPYERFERVGAQALTDAELIAIIIRTGTVGEDALALAHRVLALTSGRTTGILALNSIPLEELLQIKEKYGDDRLTKILPAVGEFVVMAIGAPIIYSLNKRINFSKLI